MSRYTGPRLKKMRALGTNLPGLSRKSIARRPYPPGEHGDKRRRKKTSFGKQLMEKQKLRLNYGVNERQLRKVVRDAKNSKDFAGVKICELLERRLDNVVFRAGFAATIPAARQLVNHGHLRINGRRACTPSIRVAAGDVVTFRERSKKLQCVTDSLEVVDLARPEWIEVEAEKREARILTLPTAESVPFEVDIQQVIEYYSK
jgi:small subunit ribosomal protein S4